MKNILKVILNVNKTCLHEAKIDKLSGNLIFKVHATKGEAHRCPICGKKCSVYDTSKEERLWRHLDIFGRKTYFSSKICRVSCKKHGIITERVPWANHKSRFTYSFENLVAYLCLKMNKADCSTYLRINWHTVGEILSRKRDSLEPDLKKRCDGIERIGIDETSYKKGHKYITIVVNHDNNEVVWIKEGHDSEVLQSFFDELSQEQRDKIKIVTGDGANWIKPTVEKNCKNALFCLDPFHVVQWATKALDEVRRDEIKNLDFDIETRNRRVKARNNNKKLKKGYKFCLLKNPENLTENQKILLKSIESKNTRLYRAYKLKEGLRLLFQISDESNIEANIDSWLNLASRSRIHHMVELGRTIRKWKEQIILTIKADYSNARIESTNNKIKVLIKRSYGFRNLKNMFDLIYFMCSGLKNQLNPGHYILPT